MNNLGVIYITLSIAFAAVFVGCDQKQPSTNIPTWLNKRIDNLEIDPSVPVTVNQSTYNGSTVYYISSTVPDGYGSLFDASGKLIGCPDGGMDGKGDGKCADYFDKRTDVMVLWSSTK